MPPELGAVHPSDDQAIELLTGLVGIPSPSRQERAAAEWLAAWMGDHGFAASVDQAGNAVGVKGRGDKEILLLGHVDTFPGALTVRRDDDLLFGRGTVDAKGPLCALVVAAARARVADGWRVTVVGAVEEETATSRGARQILAERAGGRPPAYCVIGEPSRWHRITLGYKGRLVLEVKLRAPYAHSAGAHPLPAEMGVAVWQSIEDYCRDWKGTSREQRGAFAELSPSLRSITTADDGAFGIVTLSVGVRLPLSASAGTVEAGLRRAMGNAAPHAEVSCTVVGTEPAYKAGKSNPLVRAFLGGIRGHGGAPRFVVKTGTSDMNVVGPAWPGTPMVAYGPGDSALDHTPDEHVDLREYLRAIAVLEAVLERVLNP